jgi:glycerophosphoryl diester phosphodiesterase
MRIIFSAIIFCLSFNLATGQSNQLYCTKIKKGYLLDALSYEANKGTTLISAHRGGRFIRGYPENAIETFEYTLTQVPALIECDIEMTKDSVLILMHDNTLNRTTTGVGKVRDTTWQYIQNLRLIDDFGDTTSFKVPLLTDALAWAKKKAVLQLDVKRGVPFEKVIQAVKAQKMEDYVIIITYNIEDAKKVYALNPNLLISISIRSEEEFERFKASEIPSKNLIAFTGTILKDDNRLYELIHQEGALAIIGTMGNLDNSAKARGIIVFRNCIEKGVDVIATDYPLEVAKALDDNAVQELTNKYLKLKTKKIK